jgi:heme-degrading monooxygenase HmoA
MFTPLFECATLPGELDGEGFVVLSTYLVADDAAAEARDALRKRGHPFELASGFVRMEILSPCERPGELWLVTLWTDRESYSAWHRAYSHREAPLGAAEGLTLQRDETLIREFARAHC